MTRFSSPPTSERFPSLGFVAFLPAILLLFLSACNDTPPPVSQTTASEETASTPEQCERDIDNLLDALQPDRFGISSDRDVTVNMLNTWLLQCGAAEEFSTDARDAELRERLLSESANAEAALNQFTDFDADYLRNSILVQQMVDSTLSDERSDIERAVTLFYKVVRTVELIREMPEKLAFGPLEALLYGRGTSENRAWIYGMMLRQLRIDAVVIRPRETADDNDRSLLVGVVIPEEGVYLFDFRLGVPLASLADDPKSPLPMQPATLAAARENDAIFRQHDLRGVAYPLTAEQMTDIEVLAIGNSATWAPRFGKLQSSIPTLLEVYVGLTANSVQEQGLIDRLASAGMNGLWDADDIGVWEYPDRTLHRLKSLTPGQLEVIKQLEYVMQGPFNVGMDPENGQVQFELPVRDLRQARLGYIQGDTNAALQVYLRSRLSIPHPKTPNQAGSDWSAYWAALAQYEQAEYSVAAESSGHYLKSPGIWITAAKTLQANALAQEGKFDDAIRILEREPVRAPQHLGNQSRVRRWRRLAKGESAIDPKLISTDTTPKTDPDSETPTNEPAAAKDSPEDEEPPDPNRPRETPTDLPPSEERPDTRFEAAPQENLPPADEQPSDEDSADNE